MKKFAAILLAVVMMLSMSAMAASITITPPTVDTDASEEGITYTAYKIFDATISGDNDEYVSYTITTSSAYYETIKAYSNLNTTENKTETEYFTLTQVAGSTNTYVVTATAAYTEDAADSFAAVLAAVTGVTAAGTTNTKTNNTIEGLDDGYYLVTSSVGTDMILDTIGSITVATKNEYPTIEKTVSAETADMGQELTFTIKVKIPEDATGEIVVHDKMTNLEYVKMTAVDGITATTNGLTDGCSVEFTLSADYVANNKGTTVTITYTAKVTADSAKNEAWLVDDTYTSKPVEVDVYSTDVVINKVVSGTETALSGAKFVLYKVVAIEGVETNYYYVVDENGVVTWVTDIDNATVVTTNDEGKAEFENIADGTYYLHETAAPAGYNLLTKDVTVEVAATVSDGAVVDITTKVENSAGSELPSTGGMGTTVFYVVGGLMMAAAVVLLVARKKVAAK